MKKRVIGYDFARAFAIFGMVIINYKIVMTSSTQNHWLKQCISLIEGRAAAVFVILAGVGISLMTQKALDQSDSTQLKWYQYALSKRALLLIVLGLSYSFIYEADILHFYGFYMLFGVLVLHVQEHTLLVLAAVFNILFVALLLTLDYNMGWDWNTLSYQDFWSVQGMFRHIFFNGFHPVFPWTSFLLIGMWLGRQDVSDQHIRRKILWFSLCIAACTLLISKLALMYWTPAKTGLSSADAQALLGTSPMPPMPQYILFSASLAIFFILLCIECTTFFAEHRWVDWMCRTGRMSLTFYVAHVLIGMGFLQSIGMLEKQSIYFAFTHAILFNLGSVFFAVWWSNKYTMGPLEWSFRKLAEL